MQTPIVSENTIDDLNEKGHRMSFMKQRKSFPFHQAERVPESAIGDWAESEWFQVWLQLARRDYHGNASVQNTFPARELAADDDHAKVP